LNNDKPGDLSVGEFNGDIGNDCLYFGVWPTVEDPATFSAGAGNDFVFIDNNVEGQNLAEPYAVLIKLGDGDDLLIDHGQAAGGVVFNLDGGDDQAFIKNANFQSVHGGTGNDEIFVDGPHAFGNYVYGEAGDDRILVRDGAALVRVYGDVTAPAANTGEDYIRVFEGAFVSLVQGGVHDDTFIIDGNVLNITALGGNDDIIVHGGAGFVNGGDGDDSVRVFGHAGNIVGGVGNDDFFCCQKCRRWQCEWKCRR